MTDIPALPREVQQALRSLRADLTAAGYEAFEVNALVDGAQERAEVTLADAPETETTALVALVETFADLDVEPDAPAAQASDASAKLGVAIALVSGLAILTLPLFGSSEEAGGAILILAALLGGPAALLLGRKQRETGLGQAAMLLGGLLIAIPVVLVTLTALNVL